MVGYLHWLVGCIPPKRPAWPEEICRMRLRNPGSGLCVHRQVWVPEEGSWRAHCCGLGSYWDSESTWTNWRIAGSLAVELGGNKYEQIHCSSRTFFLVLLHISPNFSTGSYIPDRQSHFFHMGVVFANKNLAALCFSQKMRSFFGSVDPLPAGYCVNFQSC